MDKNIIARFFTKVDKNGPVHPVLKTRCHLWTAAKSRLGYGQFGLSDGTHWKTREAHRVAFFIKHGRWPKPQALHRCDNRACVRLDHLFEGTQADNMRDAANKGRIKRLTGSANGRTKIDSDRAAEIVEAYVHGTSTQQELAELMQVGQSTISRVLAARNAQRSG